NFFSHDTHSRGDNGHSVSSFLTRFLHANRYPPRIKSGAGFRSKTLLPRQQMGWTRRHSKTSSRDVGAEQKGSAGGVEKPKAGETAAPALFFSTQGAGLPLASFSFG